MRFSNFEVVLFAQGVARSGTTISPCKLREPFSRLTASSRQTAEYNVLNINLFLEAIETEWALRIYYLSPGGLSMQTGFWNKGWRLT